MGLPKGQTNNPNGRPVGSQNKNTKAIKDLIDSVINTQELISELVGIVKDEDKRIRLEAIKLLLAYRYGKPAQSVELSSDSNDEGAETIELLSDILDGITNKRKIEADERS